MMELILFAHGAVTIVLLVAHVDDYMKTWPERPFAFRRWFSATEGRGGISGPSPEVRV